MVPLGPRGRANHRLSTVGSFSSQWDFLALGSGGARSIPVSLPVPDPVQAAVLELMQDLHAPKGSLPDLLPQLSAFARRFWNAG